MVIIDVNREQNAVHEAKKLGIPTICLIDTDSDPDYADIPIPGNDDAMRAIEVVVQSLCAAVMEGKTARTIAAEGKTDDAKAESTRRRSSRSQFRAEDAVPAADAAPEEAPSETAASTAPAADSPDQAPAGA
jgi:small subunit ribosomal protein S2